MQRVSFGSTRAAVSQWRQVASQMNKAATHLLCMVAWRLGAIVTAWQHVARLQINISEVLQQCLCRMQQLKQVHSWHSWRTESRVLKEQRTSAHSALQGMARRSEHQALKQWQRFVSERLALEQWQEVVSAMLINMEGVACGFKLWRDATCSRKALQAMAEQRTCQHQLKKSVMEWRSRGTAAREHDAIARDAMQQVSRKRILKVLLHWQVQPATSSWRVGSMCKAVMCMRGTQLTRGLRLWREVRATRLHTENVLHQSQLCNRVRQQQLAFHGWRTELAIGPRSHERMVMASAVPILGWPRRRGNDKRPLASAAAVGAPAALTATASESRAVLVRKHARAGGSS